MLTRVFPHLGAVRRCVIHCRRNIGVSAPALQKADVDPIQQMFLTKIREYAALKKKAGDKLVDATPAQEKGYQEQLDNITKQFGVGTEDFTKFPTFSFKDPVLHDPREGFQAVHLKGDRDIADESLEVQEDEDETFFDDLFKKA